MWLSGDNQQSAAQNNYPQSLNTLTAQGIYMCVILADYADYIIDYKTLTNRVMYSFISGQFNKLESTIRFTLCEDMKGFSGMRM